MPPSKRPSVDLDVFLSSGAKDLAPKSKPDAGKVLMAEPRKPRPRRRLRIADPPVNPVDKEGDSLAIDVGTSTSHPVLSSEAGDDFFSTRLCSQDGRRRVRMSDSVGDEHCDPSVPRALLEGLALPRDMASLPPTGDGLMQQTMVRIIQVGQLALEGFNRRAEESAEFARVSSRAEKAERAFDRSERALTEARAALRAAEERAKATDERARAAEEKAEAVARQMEEAKRERFEAGKELGGTEAWEEARLTFGAQVQEMIPRYHKRGYMKALDAMGVAEDAELRQAIPPVDSRYIGEPEKAPLREPEASLQETSMQHEDDEEVGQEVEQPSQQ